MVCLFTVAVVMLRSLHPFCFLLCSKRCVMMYAITLLYAMALELENVYVGTDAEVTTPVVGSVGVVSVFMCGFVFGATWSYYRGVRTLRKALDFMPVAEGRYAAYTMRFGYAFHVSNNCEGLRSAGQLQIRKACKFCLADLAVDNPTVVSREAVENCALL